MVKYAPRKVYIRESGGYVELSYTEFCRCRESDQTYMDKLFIPIQGCPYSYHAPPQGGFSPFQTQPQSYNSLPPVL